LTDKSITGRVPHKHAEAIKAWADGWQIEYRPDRQQHWTLCGHAFKPSWSEEYEYRVKPEKVYPVTQMTTADFNSALAGDRESLVSEGTAIRIANAALRHAIDANQIIAMAEHQDALIALGQNLRGVEIARHAARDMAIAEAVQKAFLEMVAKYSAGCAHYVSQGVLLPLIIAGVHP
jgi:hypothetical protein